MDLTQIDASIGLLIGVDSPKALELWRIINSKGTGKYAVKMLLGWAISPLSLDMDGIHQQLKSVEYLLVTCRATSSTA